MKRKMGRLLLHALNHTRIVLFIPDRISLLIRLTVQIFFFQPKLLNALCTLKSADASLDSVLIAVRRKQPWTIH